MDAASPLLGSREVTGYRQPHPSVLPLTRAGPRGRPASDGVNLMLRCDEHARFLNRDKDL
jgi:hypothetical protein